MRDRAMMPALNFRLRFNAGVFFFFLATFMWNFASMGLLPQGDLQRSLAVF